MIAFAYTTFLLVVVDLQATSARPFDPWTDAARYRLEYRVDLASIHADTPDTVRIWLPVPADRAAQRVLSLDVESSWTHRTTHDDRGNRFVHTRRDPGQPKDGELIVRAVVRRAPWSAASLSSRGRQSARTEVRGSKRDDPQRFLGAQRFVPTGGRIREIAAAWCAGANTPAEKMRALYDHVLLRMRYDKQGTGWGRGDAVWACDAKYGNCTDFHSVLIATARSQGLPARFTIGFPMPSDRARGEVAGYHCWAEWFDPQRGWVPVDASEAWKNKRHDAYFGELPADRVAFTTGRDLLLAPPQAGQPLNFLIYPYAEVNGRPVETPRWNLRFTRDAFEPLIGRVGQRTHEDTGARLAFPDPARRPRFEPRTSVRADRRPD